MQEELRLKGRFVARFTVGVFIDEEEEDDNGVVVGQDHFQSTGEQISSSPLADQVTKVRPSSLSSRQGLMKGKQLSFPPCRYFFF